MQGRPAGWGPREEQVMQRESEGGLRADFPPAGSPVFSVEAFTCLNEACPDYGG